jgi:CheY-like chemotaxis protein
MSAQPPTANSRQRVLIVEDHPDGREALRLLLSLLGYDVVVAGNGVTGILTALRKHPDVVILDVNLPKLDGCDAARVIRAALGQSVQLIAYTAYDPCDLDCRVEETDFDSWLVKPASIEALERCMHRGRLGYWAANRTSRSWSASGSTGLTR